MAGRTDTFDLIHEALFTEKELQLSEQNQKLLFRIKDGYTVWLENPHYTTRQMRDYMMVNHDLNKNQALYDLNMIQMLLGNVNNASRAFIKYKVNFILDKAYAAAEQGDERKAKALTKVAETLVKNNRTDIEDETIPDFEQIVIKDWSFSTDVSLLGIKTEKNLIEKAEKLRKKHLSEIGIIDIEDVEDENES